MLRPCGKWSETPCHIDCATVGEWNAVNYDWAKRKARGQELIEELERASEDYEQIPEYLRPVITVPRQAGKSGTSKGETEMEPITREVYLAVLSMLGAKVENTRSVHMYYNRVEIEEYTTPRVVEGNEIVTQTRVIPVTENGYISRVRG